MAQQLTSRCEQSCDNLSNTIAGGDENTAKDMTIVRGNMTKLSQKTGAFVLMLAHSGKIEAAGIRGSSSLGGMADAILAGGERRCDGPKERSRMPTVGNRWLPA